MQRGCPAASRTPARSVGRVARQHRRVACATLAKHIRRPGNKFKQGLSRPVRAEQAPNDFSLTLAQPESSARKFSCEHRGVVAAETEGVVYDCIDLQLA